MARSTQALGLGRLGNCRLAVGDSLEDRASRFVARIAYPITSVEAAQAAIGQMKRHGNAGSADHNIFAYRVACGSAVKFDCHDDGEDRAGGRLLAMLNKEKALGVAVVVSRWFGGINLGPVRFQHICGSARILLQQCGHRPGVPMQEAERDFYSVLSAGTPASAESVPARRELAAAAADRRAIALAQRGGAVRASPVPSTSTDRQGSQENKASSLHGESGKKRKNYSGSSQAVDAPSSSSLGATPSPRKSAHSVSSCSQQPADILPTVASSRQEPLTDSVDAGTMSTRKGPENLMVQAGTHDTPGLSSGVWRRSLQSTVAAIDLDDE